jgi:hypothetical protein
VNGLAILALLWCVLVSDVRELVLRWAPIPNTAQEQFFDDDTPEAKLLFTGGRGSGKTASLVAKVLKLSAINAPLPGIWLVPTWDHVEKTILPALEDTDPETQEPWFLSPGQYSYHQTKHILTWEGGGPIWFFTAENFKGIAGPNVAWMAVDEPGSIDERAWRNAVARVRHPNAALRQIVASGTPEGLNWLYEWFGESSRSDRNKVYRMRTTENVELLKAHPDFIEQIRENATEAEVQSYLDGQFTNLTGALAFPVFDERLHWRTDVAIDPQIPLRLTFDFNVNPMTLGLGQIVSGPHGPELRIVDWISEYGGATVESCCEALRAKYPDGWKAGATIYGDATGKARHVKSLKSNYQIIREALAEWAPLTEKVPAANPAVSESLNAVNRLLKNANGVTRLWIRKTEPTRVCATRELVRSLQRTSKKTGTDEIEKKAGETHTHAGEALRYLVAVEFPVLKPRVVVGTARWGLD